jgi:acyl carrier protein phosphodiesterase
MNWLAHVFLSEQKIDFQIGNFLADPLKGKAWDGASLDMIKGMETHKQIDSYTDSHKVVSTSKARLRKKGLLKGVIIDLVYDYLLTKNWSYFSNLAKNEFLTSFNKNAQDRLSAFPERPRKLVANLTQEDRLNKYNSLEQLHRAFQRIDTRLSPQLLARETATSYFDEVCAVEEDLEKDFMSFFPELCSFIRTDINSEHLTHWKIIK